MDDPTKYKEPKPIDEETVTLEEDKLSGEIIFQKFKDPDNIYWCSVCDEPVMQNEEFWHVKSIGSVLCSIECKAEFLEAFKDKIKESAAEDKMSETPATENKS